MPPRDRPQQRRVGAIAWMAVLLVIGAGLFVGGQVWSADQERLEAEGARTTGTVTHFRDSPRISRRTIVVSYDAGDGVVRTTSGHADHEEVPGSTLEVAFDPADPARAVIVSHDAGGALLRGTGLVLTIVFLPATVLVALAQRARRRREQERRSL